MENYSFLSVPRGGLLRIYILASRLNFLNFCQFFLELCIFASNWVASKWAFLLRVGIVNFLNLCLELGASSWSPRIVHFASNWAPRVGLPRIGYLPLLCIVGGLRASPKNEVAGIACYISNVSFQIVRPTF